MLPKTLPVCLQNVNNFSFFFLHHTPPRWLMLDPLGPGTKCKRLANVGTFYYIFSATLRTIFFYATLRTIFFFFCTTHPPDD